MRKNKLVMPVVKWVGGKRQLLPILPPLLPEHFTTYCEPFLGGGAMLFWRQPNQAIVNDINSDLILMYEVIRDNVEDLIAELETHINESEHFYEVRDWDRNRVFYNALTNVQKAARIIYLMSTEQIKNGRKTKYTEAFSRFREVLSFRSARFLLNLWQKSCTRSDISIQCAVQRSIEVRCNP